MNRTEIAHRLPEHAEALLREKGYIAPVDLLLRLTWLQNADYQAWRTGKVPYLERVVSGTLSRLNFTMGELHRFARDRGLRPSLTAYMKWGKGARTPLRFSRSGEPYIERAYATHWLLPRPASAE
jgi:hypothetical protein